MSASHVAEELARIRAEITRLHQREAALCRALSRSPDTEAPQQPPQARPGWPIRRLAAPDQGLH